MLAIDISSEFLHLLQLNPHRGGWDIIAHTAEALPKGVVSLQRLVDPAQFGLVLQRALKSFTLHNRRTKNKVIMALPVNQTITKTVPMVTDLSPQAVKEYLQQAVNQQMLTTTTEIFWDYTLKKQEQGMEATVTIAQQAVVHAYQQVFADNHLHLQVIDTEAYALARAAQACCLPQDNYAVLLLRRELLTMVLITPKHAIYARTTPLEVTASNNQALVAAVAQLLKSFNFGAAMLEIDTLFLAGEYAMYHYADAISQKLNLATRLVALPESRQFTLDGATFPRYFLSLGLALWSQ